MFYSLLKKNYLTAQLLFLVRSPKDSRT